MKFTLRQLGYLTAFAETHHFGRAAEKAGVSQPALSTQLRELEAQLGGLLIARDAPGLPLTPLGREVLAHARAVLAEVRALKETARRAAEGEVSVRLGLIPTVAPYLVPPLLPLAEAAGAHLSIREAVTETLLSDLGMGMLDAAVIALPAPAGFAAIPVADDQLLLAMPPAALAPEMVAPRRADEIDAARLLLLDREHCLSEQTLQACRIRESAASLRLGAASLGTLARLVASGQGVMLMPEMAAAVEGRDLRLSRFLAPAPSRRIALLGHGGARDQGWFTRLAALLAEAAHVIPRAAGMRQRDAPDAI
jgi:LysR family transcriptional regulator, hydrogen peroxide-inducible genes activator